LPQLLGSGSRSATSPSGRSKWALERRIGNAWEPHADDDRYNFVVASAWPTAIAIAAIIIFFAVQLPEVTFEWWGTDVSYLGCEGVACTRLKVAKGSYFGPEPGSYP
jgi:hypothetical protein